MLTPYYIYRHIRPDTNDVFYIGKGNNRRGYYTYERSKDKASRNVIWQRLVAKCGGQYEVEIVMEFASPEECVAKEKELIALYGRIDCGTGTLTNLTDGGDGTWGLRVRPETRAKLKARNSGPGHPNWGKKLSAETCARKSRSLTGAKHHLYGKKLPVAWRENIRKSKFGVGNPMFGKTGQLHPRAIVIRDTATGTIFHGVPSAAKAFGLTTSIVYQYLDGTRPNKTTLVREGNHA